MEVTASARKHGISDADIVHAWNNAQLMIDQEHDGEERIFVIGPDQSGNPLELVARPATEPTQIIHADQLRPKFHDRLRQGG